MKRAWAIAVMTFIEARRNRTTMAFFLFALVMVMTSFLFQEVTIAAHDRILRDVGLAAIHAFGTVLAILLGVSVVSREIERKTAYILLTKRLSRSEYIFGKLLGICITLFATLGLMTIAFVFEAWAYAAPLAPAVFAALWLIFVELLLLGSFSIFASSFTSPMMSAFMSIGLFLIGRFSSDLYTFSHKSPSAIVRAIGAALFYALPNLERLNLKAEASLLRPVDLWQVFTTTIYGLLYIAAFLALAVAVFQRRDLK